LGLSLTVPTHGLASAIVEEFSSQGQKKDLRKMPLAQLALTALDVSSQRREDTVKGIMRLGENELVCQRASDPADLVAEQNKIWQPYLDWCKKRFNADLETGTGIIPFDQNPEALSRIRAYVEELDAFTLAGLHEACHALGSLVLGLALLEGEADAAAVFQASELDHLWQAKKWGEDPASQARLNAIKTDLNVCAKWFILLKK
ncbi:MAG: ATPase, partial [Alphaproteobacteria bacterium]|nr:ATPase [Alphaproteobacteria bacterium]